LVAGVKAPDFTLTLEIRARPPSPTPCSDADGRPSVGKEVNNGADAQHQLWHHRPGKKLRHRHSAAADPR
jgi:hypothetical protein